MGSPGKRILLLLLICACISGSLGASYKKADYPEPGRCESDGDCLKGKAKCIWRECHCIQKFAVGDGKTKCDTVTPQGDRWLGCAKEMYSTRDQCGEPGSFPMPAYRNAYCVEHINYGRTRMCKCLPGHFGRAGRPFCMSEKVVDKNGHTPCVGDHNCHEFAKCKHHKCYCNTGFLGNGDKCTDIDECADPKLNTCAENTKCLNKPGSFDCTCVPGYESTDKGTAEGKDLCQDIDECSDASLNTCGENTKCENSPGSFDCTCAPGFESTDSEKTNGKDITCEDIDECTGSNNTCGENAKCENNPGGFNCACESGFESVTNEPLVCKDIDECEDTSLHTCSGQSLKCVNHPGGYSCTCAPGYKPVVSGKSEGQDIQCEEIAPSTPALSVIEQMTIDECAKKPCHAKATCTNTKGSYKCKCKLGWKGDGKRCAKLKLRARPAIASRMSLRSPIMLIASAGLGCLALF